MAKKMAVDTSALLAGMIGKTAGQQEKEVKPGRPPCSTKNGQAERKLYSFHITTGQSKMLGLQAAEKIKGKDRSAIVRAGLDIILTLSDDTYSALKTEADTSDKSIGEVVEAALIQYFKIKE